MKHGQVDSPPHPAHVDHHHGANAWVGIIAFLLAICGVAAIYYYRKCRSSYRKKRRVTRRAQSAAELSPSAVATANKRVSFRTRSSSTEQKDDATPTAGGSASTACSPDTERTPLVKEKIDSLARLLLRRATGRKEEQRHSPRYQYSALDAGGDCVERLELERRAREGALAVCRRYLIQTPRYEFLRHLNDVGSRIDKHWFVVRDVSVKTDRLLSLVPVCNDCPIPCNQATRDIILELFRNLQHPYIYPVLDFEFTEVDDIHKGSSSGFGSGIGLAEDNSSDLHAVLVMPFNTEGSLKDLIYGSDWQDDWSHKYGRRSLGLPLTQIQRLGRQILEALLFLRERGFPPYGHLHSGNVILQNGVARLAGLENTLLGYRSRCHNVIWRRARGASQHIDVICFGHVLFEMAAGYELSQPQPSPGHLQLDLERCPQVVDVLDLIFQPPILDSGSSQPLYHYPSLEELLVCELFRYVDLREMRGTGSRALRLPPAVRALLDDVRKPRRACASEPSSPMARERRFDPPRYSQDDHSLSDDPCGGDSLQHRELMLHLSKPTQPLSPPFCHVGSAAYYSLHTARQQEPCLLAVR